MFILYTRPSCQACRLVERELIKNDQTYQTQELTDETIQDYEQKHGVRPKQAPILELNGHMEAGLVRCRDLVRNAQATQ